MKQTFTASEYLEIQLRTDLNPNQIGSLFGLVEKYGKRTRIRCSYLSNGYFDLDNSKLKKISDFKAKEGDTLEFQIFGVDKAARDLAAREIPQWLKARVLTRKSIDNQRNDTSQVENSQAVNSQAVITLATA